MIELSLRTDFSRMERALQVVASRQIPFAAARALNDIARSSGNSINAHMGEIFDRPTPFTSRAVIAPRALAASREHLVATVTVRPIQQKYLLHEEIGGTREPAENTRKQATALVLPGRGLLLDQFGNIPRGTLKTLGRQAKPSRRSKKAAAAVSSSQSVAYLPANAPGNKAQIGGFFQRREGHGLTRLTLFETTTHYTPRMHYRDRVAQVARAEWPAAFRRRLAEAIATAR